MNDRGQIKPCFSDSGRSWATSQESVCQAATQTLCPSASIWGWDCAIGSEAGNSEAVSKAWRDTQQNALVLQIPPYALPQPKKKKVIKKTAQKLAEDWKVTRSARLQDRCFQIRLGQQSRASIFSRKRP